MNRRNRWIALGVAVLAIGAGGSIAIANGTADDDTPLTVTDLDRATQAALEHTGGGTVIESELGDDGAAYGIEIRKDDGSVVEVNLDESFNVIGSEPDDDNAGGDDDGAGDDGNGED